MPSTGYSWSLSVAGRSSPLSAQTTSYSPPSLSSVTVSGPSVEGGDEDGTVPTAGGATVTVTGANFGGGTADIVLTWYGARHLALPHTMVSLTSLLGQGVGANVTLSVGGQSDKRNPSCELESMRAGWKPNRSEPRNTTQTQTGCLSCLLLSTQREHTPMRLPGRPPAPREQGGTATCHSIQKTCGSQYSLLAVRCARSTRSLRCAPGDLGAVGLLSARCLLLPVAAWIPPMAALSAEPVAALCW
jgi:hypothetical protein